jgi:hypothetical protein
MNPTTISSLALDTSGTSIDNRIVNEPHTLKNFRFRALVLDQGAFYADSLVITDAVTQRVLTPGVDFKFLVPYTSLSQLYGHDIVGAAMIVNPDVSSSVLSTYQAVGSDYVHNIPALVDILNTDNLSAVSEAFLDIQNRPIAFVPNPHIHDLGDGVGFEYLVFAIETLGRVMNSADSQVLASMFDRIDIKLQEIARSAIYRQDVELTKFLEDFRKDFTKEKLGLGKVPNYPAASESDGTYAANATFNMGGEINNRLVTLSSLIAFREELMSRLVTSEKTGLGRINGQYMLPTMAGLESMANGSRYIIDSADASLIAGVTFDKQVYPDLSVPSHRWAIVKITNNVADRGGLFQAFNMLTGQLFTGVLSRVANQSAIVWRRVMTEADVEGVVDLVTKHMNDKNNPHKLTANDIGLGLLENLRVADRTTILGRKAKRELITYDGLELFFSAWITGDWTIDDTEGTTPEQKAKARNAYTTLFAVGGTCGSGCDEGEGGLKLIGVPRETLPPVPVRGQPAGWYCEGTTKVAKFTDGRGGYYLTNVPNDSDCGFINETANYQIRDASNDDLLGLGFAAGGRVDPAATVALQDTTGVTLCWIYPTPATGRSTAVRNTAGTVLGYALDPV